MSKCLTIFSHRQRLDAAFGRAVQLEADPELQADFARYLCVLVAGFVEKSVSEIVVEHAKNNGSPTLQRFIERNARKFTNANAEKVLSFIGSFSSPWRVSMEEVIVDERRAALDSIYGLRNTIAHGGNVGLTYSQVSNYYGSIKIVIEKLEELCLA